MTTRDAEFDRVLKEVIDRAQDIADQSEKTVLDHQRVLKTNEELRALVEQLRGLAT